MVASMKSELNDLNSKPQNEVQTQLQLLRDDRPLPKSESTTSISTESLQDLEKKFAAFVRRDVYGTMGRGNLPTKEKVLLGLALVTLVPIRVVLALTILLVYYFICRICTLFSMPNRDQDQEDYAHMGGWRRAVIVQSGKALSRLMLFVLGFYWISEFHRVSDANDASTTEVTLSQCVSLSNTFVISLLFLMV